MPATQTVIVTLSDEAAQHMDEVSRALERAGLEISETLEFLGQVTGRCNEKSRRALSSVPGVLSVEDSGAVSIPSPGSEIQ